jgi:hypothetical protein
MDDTAVAMAATIASSSCPVGRMLRSFPSCWWLHPHLVDVEVFRAFWVLAVFRPVAVMMAPACPLTNLMSNLFEFDTACPDPRREPAGLPILPLLLLPLLTLAVLRPAADSQTLVE